MPTVFLELTPRQREVAELLSAGVNRHDIEAILGFGSKTFDTHRSRILKRLGIKSDAQLSLLAIGRGCEMAIRAAKRLADRGYQ